MTTNQKISVGVIVAIAIAAIVRVLAPIGLIGIMLFGSFTSRPEVYDEIDH